MNDEEHDAASVRAAITKCNRLLRLTTVLILGAFVLIIVSTTISTGPLVQHLGKIMYWIIVISAVGSLGIWMYRGQLEHKLGSDSAEPPRSSSR